MNFHGKNNKISKLLSHKIAEFWREKHLKFFFSIFRDSLNTGEHEHDELPKSIIVTNVDLSVFDNIDIKVINELIGLTAHLEY